MNEPTPNAEGWKTYQLLLYGTLVGLCFLAVVAELFAQMIAQLVLGWVLFLGRVVPALELEWEGCLTAVVCAGVFIGLGHYFACWLYHAYRTAMLPTDRTFVPWPWRWTLTFLGLVVVLFIAGIAATGLVHQTVWLFQSNRSVPSETVPV